MKTRAVLCSAAVALLSTGCGAAAEQIAERATEEVLEEALEGEGIEDIDIDSDGTISITGDDGEQIEIDTGSGADLPDGWPEEITMPAGVEVVGSTRAEVDGVINYSVQFTGNGSFEDAVAHVRTYDGTPTLDQQTNYDGTNSLLLGWEHENDRVISVIMTEEDGKLSGTIILAGWDQ